MTTIKENSLTISNIYKSRKIMLELLKERNYDVDEWDDFSINEIQSMHSNNQLDMLLKHKTNGRKIYIKYYIHKNKYNDALNICKQYFQKYSKHPQLLNNYCVALLKFVNKDVAACCLARNL